MTTDSVQTRPRVRLAFIDNLRVALTVLVVAHHAALPYGNLGLWPNWEQPPTVASALALDVFVLLNQTFFMGFFFLLAGLFVPGSADRRGAGGFARERLRRLGIPFLVALVVVRPLYSLPTYLGRPPAERVPYWEHFLTSWDIGPLWFLEVLLALSLGYALLRRWRPSPADATPTPLRAHQVALFAIGLGLVSYVWRMIVPIGTMAWGLPTPAYLPQYVALFVVGVLTYRRGWLTALPHRAGTLSACLVIASLLPMVLLGGLESLDPGLGLHRASLYHLGFALWDAMFATGVILALVVAFRRHATGDGPGGQFLARNAFAVYLIHAPVVVGVVALMGPLALPPLAKFAVALFLTLLISWALAALIRRQPRIGSMI
ncbi:acyltransferase family protein [Ruania zhangjianzhongii]|uniref:acyltransferase family protein n=1 Tax=Ruania zhangjianzhongii TaxID=2603206 RepID=UPI0011CC7B59|nr:acyltransferase [Ruania zhangjianzhongii]